MNFSLLTLSLISFAYLGLLFGLAHVTDKGLIPHRWVRHPLVYVLSLGVYAGTWAVYGAVGMAHQFGFTFIAYYLGVSGAFLLAPVLLNPVLRISRAYQLTSLADLFAFRYRSQWSGTLATLLSAAAILSLLSMQIKAVASSAALVSASTSPTLVGIVFSAAMVLFTILFGASRKPGGTSGADRVTGESHQGLVAAMAFDSLIKLGALLLLGGVILHTVFDGFSGLNQWLASYNASTQPLSRQLNDGSWRALMLMSFAGALVLPHMYHMIFSENPSPRALAKANWGLPLYLFLLALPVPLILWAGTALNVSTDASYFAIGTTIALNSPGLTLLVYVAGLSAASGLTIVSTLALSGMLLNHVVLPLSPPREKADIYAWLTGVKRILIAVIILAALVFYEWVGSRLEFAVLGILALSGVVQLLPGALGVIYWPEGNHKGLIAGLIVGAAIWLATLVLPLTLDAALWADIGLPPLKLANSHLYAFASLTLNVFVFVIVSVLTNVSREEDSAAQSCSIGALSRPKRRELLAGSSEEFVVHLGATLGAAVAGGEVSRALQQLRLPNIEYRPYQLRRLRDQIEINLSGLMGPSVAQDIVHHQLGFKPQASGDPAQDIHYTEKALGQYRSQLTGLAGELDNLRRHYRQTLQNLPIATCSVGDDGEILMWNQAMQQMTCIAAETVVGARLNALPDQWHEMLDDFVQGEELRRYKHRLDIRGRPHWFNLHKSTLSGPEHPEGGNVILVEDQTETRLLEDELIHSERLASVGRLAAGVAHEVGNPITGISSLAQNLKLETQDASILETADQIQQQTRRISRILQSLMNFASTGNHAQANQYEPVTIRRCVEESINLLSLSDKGRQLHYQSDYAEDLIILGDEQRLVQVFVNLLANARDASPDGGLIRISGKREAYSAIIEIIDEGTGISADQLDHIFEPFYTTKGPNRGTGLGLSLVYSIIEEHYGHIQVESPGTHADDTGTCVRLKLPAWEPDEADNPVPESS